MAFAFACRLYPIVDDGVGEKHPLDIADAVLACDPPLIQLRMKRTPTAAFVEIARALQRRCSERGARLIINDRCDIARLVGADGVHLGQDDLDPACARRILGPEAIIGLSTHNAAQLEQATRNPVVDYLAFGPIFATLGKQNPDPATGLDALHAAAANCSVPLVAIGGIGPDTIADVLRRGADAAAVIGAISRAADPTASTADLLARAAAA